MQKDETIKCEDGSVISMELAKLRAEQVANALMTSMQKSILKSAPDAFQRVWLTTPTPTDTIETDEDFYEALKASVHLALVMGISDAMRITLNKIHAKLSAS